MSKTPMAVMSLMHDGYIGNFDVADGTDGAGSVNGTSIGLWGALQIV